MNDFRSIPDDVNAHVYVCTGFESLKATAILLPMRRPGTPAYVMWFGGGEPRYLPVAEGVHVECFPGRDQASYSAGLRQFRDFLRRHPLVQRNCAVFVPHVMHFAASFFLPRRRHAWLALLPDGMINYAARRPAAAETLKNLAKTFVGLRYGVPYRPYLYLNHITAFERVPYDATFTFSEKGLVTRAGAVVVLDAISADPAPAGDPRRIVFLDQEVSELLGGNAERRLRDHAMAYLRRQAPQTVFYKPHPKGLSRVAMVSSALGFDVQELPRTMPIEDLVGSLDAGEFVSFYSTALVSLKRTTSAKVTAVLPSAVEPGAAAFFADVEASFRAQGVNIADLQNA
ncbi:hypothetical protein P7L64_19250 [Tistrella bauzanensis]|nr:hypothetical protein [Tistrella bauzanensis]